MAELTWDELKKVVKGWTISIAEKFGITEIGDVAKGLKLIAKGDIIK